jgi:hypothetical protein
MTRAALLVSLPFALVMAAIAWTAHTQLRRVETLVETLPDRLETAAQNSPDAQAAIGALQTALFALRGFK